MSKQFIALLEKAVAERKPLFDTAHRNATRLFNGFLEGCPSLVVDLYAATVVIQNYADPPEDGLPLVMEAQDYLRRQIPWLLAGVLKTRNSQIMEERKGKLLFGEEPDRKVQEHNTWYALDLYLTRDTSLYLDTRNLRGWAIETLKGKTVLNTFAYTGSLGVAACAGGASKVVHLDLSRSFLNIAKFSYTLNGFPIHNADFIAGDFYPLVSRLNKSGTRFDCVFLDPPLFSVTSRGALDLNKDTARLINKVRPLIDDGGWLVAVNNALYVSGEEYFNMLETLCADGYLKIKEIIPVPEDFTGYPTTRVGTPITDPAPFNHSTKIAVLEVKRKKSIMSGKNHDDITLQ